jgi:hypothetical protein
MIDASLGAAWLACRVTARLVAAALFGGPYRAGSNNSIGFPVTMESPCVAVTLFGHTIGVAIGALGIWMLVIRV